MEVIINNITHEVPFDLESIKLGDFVRYHDRYGRQLDKDLQDIVAKEYEGDPEDIDLYRTLDLDNHLDREALSWFSFWTEHDLFEVKDQPFILPLIERYRIFRHLLKDAHETEIEFPQEFEWKGDIWSIADWKVNPISDITFNEVITSKEMLRQIYKVGKGHFDGLPYLCCIWLRKKNEKFTDSLVHEDGERMELMQELPLKYAMMVGFFLSVCVNSWSKTLVSLVDPEEEAQSLN